MSWEPILDGATVDAAENAILAVARDVAAGAGETRDLAQLAVFWAYVAGAFDEPWIIDHHEHALAELTRRIEAGFDASGLFTGLAGAGWALAHTADEAAAELLEVIDRALVEDMTMERWLGHYDLISGLVGIGVYFLERGEHGRAGLSRVVHHLEAIAERDAGTAWFTRPELLMPVTRERHPDGYFNLGVAHGVPGVIGLYARAGTR